jgi:hypothetical protein
VCNGFEADKIAGIMLRCNLSILTIQEPRATFDEIDIGFSKKVLLQHGIKGFFTKHQYFLYNERALGARISNLSAQMEGRLISCDLQIGPLEENTFIKIHGCYAVTQGNKKYKDGSTRDQHRRKLHNIVSNILKPTNPKENKKYVGNILAGDLQETITTTERDNMGGHFYNRMKCGVMDAIERAEKSMCSAVFEYESDHQNPYITRNEFTNSNSGRGITHIMVSSKIEDMYVGGCVDAILSSSSILSDHHLVAADFIFDIPTPPRHISQPTKRVRWGRISNILVEMTHEDKDKNNPQLHSPENQYPAH